MDSLSYLIELLSPKGHVDVHCRFRGQWQREHQQSAVGTIPYHIILKGKTQVSIENRPIILDQGDVLLLPHGNSHSLSSMSNSDIVYPLRQQNNGQLALVESIGNEPASEILCGEFKIGASGMLLLAQTPTMLHIQTSKRTDCLGLTELIAILVRESLSQLPGAQKIAQELTSTFFTLVLRACLAESPSAPGLISLLTDQRLSPAVSSAFKDPQLPWTVEKLAALCYQSRATFIRHFSQVYHLSPIEWITQLRMLRAANLLSSSSYPVGIVAEHCGYQSQSAFTRLFKQHFGITPGQYRH